MWDGHKYADITDRSVSVCCHWNIPTDLHDAQTLALILQGYFKDKYSNMHITNVKIFYSIIDKNQF